MSTEGGGTPAENSEPARTADAAGSSESVGDAGQSAEPVRDANAGNDAKAEQLASAEQAAPSEQRAGAEESARSDQDVSPDQAVVGDGDRPDSASESSAQDEGVQSPVSAEAAHDAQISAAGGVVVGESELAGQADRSRVRRAPRYRRFAVLGGLLGLVVTAFITPLASTSEFVNSGDIFLMLALTLVPLGILVTCGIAMFTDSAARKRK